MLRGTQGEVFDVAVDLRRSSPRFGQWVGVSLSADKRRQLWISPSFAHGFVVLSDFAEFLYKTTHYWSAEHERCIFWNDPELAIDRNATEEPSLFQRDAKGKMLSQADLFN